MRGSGSIEGVGYGLEDSRPADYTLVFGLSGAGGVGTRGSAECRQSSTRTQSGPVSLKPKLLGARSALEEQYTFGSLVRQAGTFMIAPSLLEHVKSEVEKDVQHAQSPRIAGAGKEERGWKPLSRALPAEVGSAPSVTGDTRQVFLGSFSIAGACCFLSTWL